MVCASSFVGPVFTLRSSKNKLRRIGRRTVIGKRRCRVHAKDAPVGKFGLDTWNYHVHPHCILFFWVISSCQQFLRYVAENISMASRFTLRSPTKKGHSRISKLFIWLSYDSSVSPVICSKRAKKSLSFDASPFLVPAVEHRVQEIHEASRDRLINARKDGRRNLQHSIIQCLAASPEIIKVRWNVA